MCVRRPQYSMAPEHNPKSFFLPSGRSGSKLREGLAGLLGASSKTFIHKTLCNFKGDFKSSEFISACKYRTGPCFVLIKRPNSPMVIGGFTRTGWGPDPQNNFSINSIDSEAFLLNYLPALLPEGISKHTAKTLYAAHGQGHICCNQSGPSFGTDLAVTEAGITAAGFSFNVTEQFIQEANFSGPFTLEVLAVWNKEWGAPEGIKHWQGTWQNELIEDAWLPGVSWGEQVCLDFSCVPDLGRHMPVKHSRFCIV